MLRHDNYHGVDRLFRYEDLIEYSADRTQNMSTISITGINSRHLFAPIEAFCIPPGITTVIRFPK